jgi:hypothetical protein
MTVNGIDIASYQSATYSTTGLGFVMIKVTEGTGYTNPLYIAQLVHARAENLVPGHYHFVRPGNMTAQADYFLQHAQIHPGDLITLDWEDGGVSGADKDAWIKYVQAKRPHNRVLLYCNRDFWLNRDHTSFAGDGLWIADPNSAAGHPNVQHAWIMHQYSSAGGLDRDVADFPDQAALRAWAVKGAAPTPPPVTHPAPPPVTHPAPTPTPAKGATVASTQDMVNDYTRIGLIGSETKPGDVGSRTMHEGGWYLATILHQVQLLSAQVVALQSAVDKLPKATS